MRKNKVASFLDEFKCQMDQVFHFFWVFFSPLKNIWVIRDIYNAVKVYKSKLCVRIVAMEPCAGVLSDHLILKAKEINLWLLGRELLLSTSSRADTSPCADPAVCVQAWEHDPSQYEHRGSYVLFRI